MKKLSEILQLAELFYKKAMQVFAAEPMLWTMPDDPEEENNVGLSGNIEEDYDLIDIKDGNLFKQLEDFMNQYNLFSESIELNPENLTAEGIQQGMELYSILNTKYERLMTNPYLDSIKFIEEEEITPELFSAFIQEVMNDVKSRIDMLEAKDISVEEILRADLPEEFNTSTELAGNAAAEKWSANRIAAALKSQRDHFTKMRQDPNRFQKYLQRRRDYYSGVVKELKKDTQKWTAFRAKKNNEYNKWRQSLVTNKAELEKQLENTFNPDDRKEIMEKLQRTNNVIKNQETKSKTYQDKRRALWDAAKSGDSLEGLAQKLSTQLDTLISEVKKKIKLAAKNDPQMAAYRTRLVQATQAFKDNPSNENKSQLEHAAKQERAALDQYCNEHAAIKQVRSDLIILKEFKDKAKILGKMDPSNEDYRPLMMALMPMGQQITSTYSRVYTAPSATITNIIKLLRK